MANAIYPRTRRWELWLSCEDQQRRRECIALADALGIGKRRWLRSWLKRSLQDEYDRLSALAQSRGIDRNAVIRDRIYRYASDLGHVDRSGIVESRVASGRLPDPVCDD